jgi:hypothetical protein
MLPPGQRARWQSLRGVAQYAESERPDIAALATRGEASWAMPVGVRPIPGEGAFHVDPARDVGHYRRCSERYRLRVWRASGLPERAAVHGKQRIG